MNERTTIMNEILETLQKNGGKMKYADLYSSIVFKYGTTEKTFWDFLSLLKFLGKINYNETFLSNLGPSETIILLK